MTLEDPDVAAAKQRELQRLEEARERARRRVLPARLLEQLKRPRLPVPPHRPRSRWRL